MILGFLLWGGGSLYAQTGPGGVEDTTGSSDLQIWMDASSIADTAADGTVQSWDNLAGDNPTPAGDPIYEPSEFSGQPVVQFDGTDDQFDFTTDFGVPGGKNTLIVVSKKSGSQDNQALIGFGAGNEARRTIEYNIKDKPNEGNRETRLVGAASGNTKKDGTWVYTDAENVSVPSILSSLFSAKDGQQYLRIDGEGNYDNSPGPASSGSFGNAVLGQNVQGDVAEVIAFSKALNAAEYKIVYNYLAQKYEINVEGTDIEDLYSRNSYTGDLGGIGRAGKIGDEVEAGSHQTARSDVLELSFDSFAKGEFVLFGHNEASRTFSSADRPNDDADVERLSRVWRTDFTGTDIDDPTTFTSVTVDAGPLSLDSFDDYAVFVSSNSDFSEGATFHNLSKNGDTYEATDVKIGDGDYVAVARLKRTVTFTSTTETIDEGSKKQLSAVAELNYPDGSDVTFSYNHTGDLDGSGSIEDGGTSNASGTNDNGDYEADGGTGSQSPTDYDVTKDITTIPAGKTTNESKGYTFEVDANDDTVKEQTEKFGFTITGIASGAAQVGTDNQLTVSIFDNDKDRKVLFAEDDYTGGDDTDNTDPNYNPQSKEGDGGSVRTNKYTIELDGGRSNSGGPCTSAKIVVDTSSSEATPGTDFSDGSVADFRIKDESDPGGTCPEYQERLSATEGRVYFSGDVTEATVKLEINEDDFEDADPESIVLELSEPVGSRLGDTNQQTLFNLDDDDSVPAVGFTSSGFSGDESQDGEITLGFENGAVGTDIGVELNDTGEGTAKSGGDDYTKDFEGQKTIPEGNGTKTVSFSVNDDAEEEKNEDVVIEIQPDKSDADTADAAGRTTYTILDNDGVGAAGPAGVGNSGSLRLWLRADQGVTSSGGSVSQWADQSGNGNDVTQSDGTNQPTYDGGPANGIPLVSFDGSDDYLETTNLAALPGGNNTVFAVSNSGTADEATRTLLGIEDSGFNSIRRLGYTNSGSSAEAYQNNAQVTASAGGLEILSTRFDGDVDVNVNAGDNPNTSGASTNDDGTYASIGSQLFDDGNKSIEETPENAFGGTVGEIIVYQRVLNMAQRRIVANYLAAKYGLSGSLVNDYYAGDTDAGFDQNVIGIGAEGTTAETQHNRAEGDAVMLSINSFSTGEYVFVGDTTYASANDINVQDASGVSGLTARSEQLRYIDTKGQPTFDITIDLNKLGLQGPAGTASNYRLLYRNSSGGGGDWSTPNTVLGRSASGDKVTFSGVQFGSAGEAAYVTIGTTNQVDSPLDTRLTTVRGNAGADRTDEGWRYYGPPGSRDSGPVQMGEIRLRTPSGRRQAVSFESAMSYIYPRELNVQDGGTRDDWQAAGPDTPLPAGRGAILFLYDDKYFPLDPELTIDPMEQDPDGMNGQFSYTGDTDVTVGDGTPGADTTLGENVDSHLLANPYEVTYDLRALQTLNQDGDGDGDNDWATPVQVWTIVSGGESPTDRGTYKLRQTDPASAESERLISPGQGFFLERNDTDSGVKTEITFSANGRQEDQAVDFVGSKSTTGGKTRRAGQIKLRLQVHEDGELVARDRAASLYFREGAEAGWDAFDAPKLTPWNRSYATIGMKGTNPDGEPALKAQESRPYELEEAVEVPLALTVEGVSGDATLSAPEWLSIPGGWTVTLVDTKGTSDPDDDVEHALRREGKNPYTFSIEGGSTEEGASVEGGAQKAQAAEAKAGGSSIPSPPSTLKEQVSAPEKSGGATDARFRVRVEPNSGRIPVEMAGLNAQAKGRSVVLEWSTASETNNAGFYVERQRLSGDTTASPEEWTRSTFVEGEGTTETPQEYREEMTGLDYGTHAFRLRQVDTDGTETVTDVVRAEVRLDGSHSVSAPYPNPVRRRATVEVTVREAQPVRIEMYDVLGRRVRTVYDEEVPGQETKRIPVDAGPLSSGHYFLRVEGEGFAETRRVTVVK